jgi:soluble lytic murein transglycosylase-like protein
MRGRASRSPAPGRRLAGAALAVALALFAAPPALAETAAASAPDAALTPPPEAVLTPPADGAPPVLDATAGHREIGRAVATEFGIPFALLDAVMKVESGYNPLAAGADGEVGLMQVMPPTAKMLGFKGTTAELRDPETNIRLGARYLAEAWRLAGADICTAVMKYRAGWRETRFSVLSVRYCRRVREHMARLGYEVTGAVPEATFGFRRDEFHQGVKLGSVAARRRLATGQKMRSRVDWRAYEQRMRRLQDAGRIGLGG